MPFSIGNKQTIKIKHHLHKIRIGQKALKQSPVIPSFINEKKRAPRQTLPANMTVEAALVMPLFLFAVINLLSLILGFQTFSSTEAKLHQSGRELSMLAYGGDGDGEQDIRLVVVSRLKAFIPIAAFPEAVIVNGCVMHKWIGYDLRQGGGEADGEKEEMVYITKFGTAYHRERGCIYLNPSVKMMGLQQASAFVNQSGRRYTPCEICGGKSEVVYVTEGGLRYHSTITCSGLRRIIDCVPLEEALAAGRHACPRCG